MPTFRITQAKHKMFNTAQKRVIYQPTLYSFTQKRTLLGLLHTPPSIVWS